jgi:hypothetical protein
MAVRNFWIEGEVDGNQTSIGAGPRGKSGGFRLRIQQRSDGEIVDILHITGDESDGILTLLVWDSPHRDSEPILRVTTRR